MPILLYVSINNEEPISLAVTKPQIEPNHFISASIEASNPTTYAINDIFVKFVPNVSIKKDGYIVMLF